MPKKTDLKFLALVTGGVMLAGFLMNALGDVEVIQDAKRGFGSIS